MSRSFIWLAGAPVLAGLLLGGCDKIARANDPSRYYSAWNGFSIKFPEGWEQQEGQMGAAVIALSPQSSPRDLFRENVNVVIARLPRKMTSQEYLDHELSQMKLVLSDYKLSRTGDARLDGRDGKYIVFYHKMGRLRFKVLTYAVTKGKKAYIITCTSNTKTFNKYKPEFEEIADSFKFE